MRTVKAQCVWSEYAGAWVVHTEPGVGAVSRASTVNGARRAVREAIESCLGDEPFEVDFQVRRWFDAWWWPSSSEGAAPRRRHQAQLNDLARAAQSGSEGAIDAFLEARRDG